MVPRTPSLRVLLAGSTGYIGQAVARELVDRGHQVVALVRPASGGSAPGVLRGCERRLGEVTDAGSLAQALRGDRFDAIVSCLASRSGAPGDAWRVDHAANGNLLRAAEAVGAGHFVLLSAICVQHPQLAFQRAKLAFEAELRAAAITHSIVRPTAFFKSLAGQIPRLRSGRPFILFGAGRGPVCKPISERDLARLLVDCLTDPDRHDRTMPIGGPGPAVSPQDRGEMLFEMLGLEPRFRRLPLGLFDAVAAPLGALARVVPSLADKAEFARIGRFYASEPMVWRNPKTGRYDAAATPSYGEDTLRAFYARVLERGLEGQELGDQALF